MFVLHGGLSVILQRFGDQERQFQALRSVQARVALGVIAVGQTCSVMAWAPPVTFSDILAGQKCIPPG